MSETVRSPFASAHLDGSNPDRADLRTARNLSVVRSAKMTEAKAALARQMHAAGGHSLAQIAEALGVSKSTVRRHLGEGVL